MHVLFDKIPTDTSRPSTPVINRTTVVGCHTHDQSFVAPRRVSRLAFVRDDVTEMLKMQHILLIMYLSF